MAENTCPKCQTANRDSARFCTGCGAPLLSGLPPQPAETPSALPPSAPANAAPPPGALVLLNRYRIEHELGRGGFGAVYRAWDQNLSRTCAVKENLDTSTEAQRQFQREATTLANLSHPNLPRVTDHFSLPSQGQYLVMDFVDGEDLASYLAREGRVPLDQALDWAFQALDALVYLHSRQPPVLHRDIKPANLRLTPDGRVMLVDFGLVKMYDPSLKTTLGARAVTPGYAPPEQYGTGRTDARSDIYALGATLYRMLSGADPLESVQRIAGGQLAPARELNPHVPPALSQALEKAMALDPGQRFQSAA
ncbi:MAG: serine/threonine-protein kinase, partial [Chloroflexota bacterium]